MHENNAADSFILLTSNQKKMIQFLIGRLLNRTTIGRIRGFRCSNQWSSCKICFHISQVFDEAEATGGTND